MSYTKTIVCLSNSRKPPAGRCVAGREVIAGGFGDWVRPVSTRATHEISATEMRYESGGFPEVLDVVTIEMNSSQPASHQSENHQIDPESRWKQGPRVTWDELQAAVDGPDGTLWLNESSSFYGTNDRVPASRADGLLRSLYLIRPKGLKISVQLEGRDLFSTPKPKVRAEFTLNGHSYCVSVTDLVAEEIALRTPEKEWDIPDGLICMSLGEDFNGYLYKLAAAVITPDRYGE